jgi:hypothetical protein
MSALRRLFTKFTNAHGHQSLLITMRKSMAEMVALGSAVPEMRMTIKRLTPQNHGIRNGPDYKARMRSKTSSPALPPRAGGHRAIGSVRDPNSIIHHSARLRALYRSDTCVYHISAIPARTTAGGQNRCPEQPPHARALSHSFALADLTACRRDCSSEARRSETKIFSRESVSRREFSTRVQHWI